MSTEEPKLGKSLFGYARSAVARILADREIMLRQAEGAVRDAETKAEELERELAEVRALNARLDRQMDALHVEVEAVPVDEPIGRIADPAELEMEAGAVDEEEIPVFSEPISMWDPEGTSSDESFSEAEAQHVVAPVDAVVEDTEEAAPAEASAFWAPAQYAAATVRGPEDRAGQQTGPEPSWFSGYEVESSAVTEPEGVEDISDVMRNDVDAGEPRPRRPEATSSFSEELAGILAAAEESAAGIVERARITTERQITESTRLWREVEAEVTRFSSWREQIEPVIRRIASKVDDVRTRIEEVPERIREALAPMADSISSLDSDMAELAAASTPPLLLKPSGLDERENEVLESRERAEQYAQSSAGGNSGDVQAAASTSAADAEYSAETGEDLTEG
ncbi:MAG TPA: hypothetical protein VHI54_07950 [Actinomycetota bacterium]|nr:hypothetical protein [Actinomycetota bacterium]